jgi:hypothetical protein
MLTRDDDILNRDSEMRGGYTWADRDGMATVRMTGCSYGYIRTSEELLLCSETHSAHVTFTAP